MGDAADDTDGRLRVVLPDGTSLSEAQIEATLAGEVAASADPARWRQAALRLARFYLETARPVDAYPIVILVRDRTDEDEMRAGCEALLRLIDDGGSLRADKGDADAHAQILLRMGAFYNEQGRAPIACAYFERVLNVAATDRFRGQARLALGIMAESGQAWEEAMVHYEAGLRLPLVEQDTRYWLHNNLAYSAVQLGRFNEAERHALAAIAIEPRRHNAYKNLGLALQGQGRLAEAAARFLDAAERAPEDERAMQHLEELIESAPELLAQERGLVERIERARRAVEAAARPTMH